MMIRFMAALLSLASAAPAAFAQATYPDTGTPTNTEQLILEIINRARANPTAEGTRLGSVSPPIGPLPGSNIKEGLPYPNWVTPKPPLAMNAQLRNAALAHSTQMWTDAFFSHTGTGGSTLGSRVTAAGYTGYSIAGENIAAGTGFSGRQLQDSLMIDLDYAGRGHRVNLLDISSPGSAPYREIGIGFYQGANPKTILPFGDLQDFLTQDFGRRSAGPFLLGVVYNDNGATPNFYDAGEGLGTVTINTVDGTMTPTGTWQGITGSAGGYSFPVGTSGTINVKPTAGITWASTIYKKATLNGENVKVDFKQSDGVDTDQDGMPDAWETANGFNWNGTPLDLTEANADADLDTFSNVEEFRFSSNPLVAASTPSNPTGGSTPPSSDDGGGGGGGCGLSGLEVLLALGLLRLRRLR